MDELALDLASSIGVPTHDRGHVLDLAFASGSLLAMETRTTVAAHLDVTSDHRPLLTLVPWDPRHKEPSRNFQLKSFNPEVFIPLLTESLRVLQPLPDDPAPTELDAHAEGLTAAIHKALEGSAKRAQAGNTGNSWWSKECHEARKAYKRSEMGETDRRQFRRVTANAKKRFREKMEAADNPGDVFRMANWHKSSGVYQYPPLRDPSAPI